MPTSRPGGSWRDWPKHLIAKCHRKKTGKRYPSVYGRMKWDEPSPTLTTQFYGFGSGRFGHPTQARALSLREGAILQGFPQNYSFVPDGGPIQFKVLGRLIGNAVPVELGRVIGESIIAQSTGRFVLRAGDQRELEEIVTRFDLSDASAKIVRYRLTGPKKGGAPFLAILQAGDALYEQLLVNSLGPVELWALSTTPGDTSLRNRLYAKVGFEPVARLWVAHRRVSA